MGDLVAAAVALPDVFPLAAHIHRTLKENPARRTAQTLIAIDGDGVVRFTVRLEADVVGVQYCRRTGFRLVWGGRSRWLAGGC